MILKSKLKILSFVLLYFIVRLHVNLNKEGALGILSNKNINATSQSVINSNNNSRIITISY